MYEYNNILNGYDTNIDIFYLKINLSINSIKKVYHNQNFVLVPKETMPPK